MDQRCVIKVIFCQAKGLVKCMPDANVNPYLIDLNRLNYQKHNSCSKPRAGFLLHQGFFFQATDCPYPSTTPWFGAWQAEDKNAITVAVQMHFPYYRLWVLLGQKFASGLANVARSFWQLQNVRGVCKAHL